MTFFATDHGVGFKQSIEALRSMEVVRLVANIPYTSHVREVDNRQHIPIAIPGIPMSLSASMASKPASFIPAKDPCLRRLSSMMHLKLCFVTWQTLVDPSI